MARKSNSEYAKEYRKRKAEEDPQWLEREREKARIRQRERIAKLSQDHEWVEKEKQRKRELSKKRRQDPEKAKKIREDAKRSRAKSENREKQSKRMKKWREENADMVAVYQKKWREENVVKISDYNSSYMPEYYAKNSSRVERQKRNLKKNYNMSIEEFNEMWRSQSGQCGICRCNMEPTGRKANSVSVDHNHDTGEVRGLLCQSCNRGIGNLKDSPEVLEAAAQYLRSNGHYSQHTLIKGKCNG